MCHVDISTGFIIPLKCSLIVFFSFNTFEYIFMIFEIIFQKNDSDSFRDLNWRGPPSLASAVLFSPIAHLPQSFLQPGIN